MEHTVPIFMGYVPAESVIKFKRQFELYAATKLYTIAQQRNIIRVALQGPASTAYETALADRTIDVTDDGTVMTTTKAWLLATYHTPEIQQANRDQLSTICQGINEDPATFNTRILDQITLTGYVPAIAQQLAETTFINGLYPEIAMQIRSAPVVQTAAEKVAYVQRYWSAWRPVNGNIGIQQLLSRDLQQSLTVQIQPTTDDRKMETTTVNGRGIRPPTVN